MSNVKKMPEGGRSDDRGTPHPTVDPLGWPVAPSRSNDVERESGVNDLGWLDRGCGSGGVTGPDGATYSGSDLF